MSAIGAKRPFANGELIETRKYGMLWWPLFSVLFFFLVGCASFPHSWHLRFSMERKRMRKISVGTFNVELEL